MRQVPGLLLLRAEPVAPWPDLNDVDPFSCNLRFRAVAAASVAEAEHLFRYVRDQVEILELPSGWPAAGETRPALSSEENTAFRTVLLGQQRLLAAKGPEALWLGRLEAAARALRGLLGYASRDHLVRDLEMAVDRAADVDGPAPLLAWPTDG